MTRDERLEWCKERAREYLKVGDVTNAVMSMLSDLRKYEELRRVGDEMGMIGIFIMRDNNIREAEKFIEGFL